MLYEIKTFLIRTTRAKVRSGLIHAILLVYILWSVETGFVFGYSNRKVCCCVATSPLPSSVSLYELLHVTCKYEESQRTERGVERRREGNEFCARRPSIVLRVKYAAKFPLPPLSLSARRSLSPHQTTQCLRAGHDTNGDDKREFKKWERWE